jgi:hypothetical protein
MSSFDEIPDLIPVAATTAAANVMDDDSELLQI